MNPNEEAKPVPAAPSKEAMRKQLEEAKELERVGRASDELVMKAQEEKIRELTAKLKGERELDYTAIDSLNKTLAASQAQVCELRTELKDAAAMASGLRAHYERSKGNYAAAASFQMRVDLWGKLLAKTSADYSGLVAVRREEWEAANRIVTAAKEVRLNLASMQPDHQRIADHNGWVTEMCKAIDESADRTARAPDAEGRGDK